MEGVLNRLTFVYFVSKIRLIKLNIVGTYYNSEYHHSICHHNSNITQVLNVLVIALGSRGWKEKREAISSDNEQDISRSW
jgi:hypothetical protein